MKKKILVVEDDKQLASMMSLLLGSVGYEVFVAYTPEEAHDLVSEHEFDLAIIDGDIGDQDCSENGFSGQLILELIDPRGIPYGRHTAQPQDIPPSLCGKFIAPKPGTDILIAGVRSVLGRQLDGDDTVKLER